MAYSIPITNWSGGNAFSLPDASVLQGANTALWNNPYYNWYNGSQGGEGWENVASPLLQNMTALDPYGFLYGGNDASGAYRYLVPQLSGIRDPNDPTRSIIGDYSGYGDVFGTNNPYGTSETATQNTWGLLPEGTTDPYSKLKLASAATPQDGFSFGDILPMIAMGGLGALIPGGFMGVLGDLGGSLGLGGAMGPSVGLSTGLSAASGGGSLLSGWDDIFTQGGSGGDRLAEEIARDQMEGGGSSWWKDMPKLAGAIALSGFGGDQQQSGGTTPGMLTKTLPATPTQTGTYQGGSYVPKWGNYGQYNSAFGNAQAAKLLGPYANMAGLGGQQKTGKGGW